MRPAQIRAAVAEAVAALKERRVEAAVIEMPAASYLPAVTVDVAVFHATLAAVCVQTCVWIWL